MTKSFVFLVALASSYVYAQQPGTRPQPTSKRSSPQNILKDAFAKSALRTLKMIEGETSGYDLGADGNLLVPRATQEALDALDIDAQSRAEQATSVLLAAFFTARLTHNTSIGAISAHYTLFLSGKDTYRDLDLRAIRVSELVSQNSSVIEMSSKESACSVPLEAFLRARRYQAVAACSAESLAVETPKFAE